MNQDNKAWPYGEKFFSESPELRSHWSNDLEIGLKVADRYFDYLWNVFESGKIFLTDRLYNDGVSDSMTQDRQAKGELVLRFNNANELFAHFLPRMKQLAASVADPELIAAAEYMENKIQDTQRKPLSQLITNAADRTAVDRPGDRTSSIERSC